MAEQLSAAERRTLDAEAKPATALQQVDELNTRRRGHAATSALLTAGQQQTQDLQGQLARVCTDFSADLARARQAVEAADERAAGAQRKVLPEVEQERAARNKSDKALEALRAQLADAEGRLRDAAVRHAEDVASLRGQVSGAQEPVTRLQVALSERSNENRNLEEQLTLQREQVCRPSRRRKQPVNFQRGTPSHC